MGRGKHKSKSPMEPQELHKVAKQPGKGKRLTSQSKTIINRVRHFFEGEKQKGRQINVLKKTAEATGVSVATVKWIYSEQRMNDGNFLTPVRRYTVSRIRVNPDSFDQGVIRQVVHSFYERKEYPTVSGVLEKVKEQCGFPGGRFCMWRVLRELGFSYK